MSPKRARSYHHGDLKRSAREAAAAIIAEEGLEAVSMRRVAERAGATHSSIYQHFDEKKTLLSAVATEGFRDLAKKMQQAARGVDGALDRVRAMAAAYVHFAAERTAHFRVMSEPDVTHRSGADSELWAAHGVVLDLLCDAVAKAQDAGALRAGDSQALAISIWTFTHGYAEAVRTRRGFYHERLRPATSRRAIGAHFRATLDPLLTGLARS